MKPVEQIYMSWRRIVAFFSLFCFVFLAFGWWLLDKHGASGGEKTFGILLICLAICFAFLGMRALLRLGRPVIEFYHDGFIDRYSRFGLVNWVDVESVNIFAMVRYPYLFPVIRLLIDPGIIFIGIKRNANAKYDARLSNFGRKMRSPDRSMYGSTMTVSPMLLSGGAKGVKGRFDFWLQKSIVQAN